MQLRNLLKMNLSSQNNKTWLITGVAGFIGVNLLIKLLNNNQKVVGLDNFYSGNQENLDQAKKLVGIKKWKNFKFYEGDISNFKDCVKVTKNVDYVLHHAALGSVPKSMEEPKLNNKINVDGFLNILLAAKKAKVSKVIYASSSAVYGDGLELPKNEDSEIKTLSPYALSKAINEYYAKLFSKIYNMNIVGLRYFNVYGPFQDRNGAYAAVIPTWIESFINNEIVYINGDGKNTRDFCHVSDVVNANIAAALCKKNISGEVFNVANGKKISLIKLYKIIKKTLTDKDYKLQQDKPVLRDFRDGDIIDSYASITKIKKIIKFKPSISFEDGIKDTVMWFSLKKGKKR